MNHRLLVAALVLGLTTTGALCGDSPDAADATEAAGLLDTPPGESGDDAGARTSDKGSDDGGDAEPVGAEGLREHSGELESGDATLNTGEYVDTYTIDVEEGQSIDVDLRSTSDLDPYIILRAPSGEQFENDDYEGDRTRSRVEHEAGESGAWRVMATSFEPGEAGSYDITIRTDDGPPSSGGGK